jgi:hypothetical protein
VAVCLDPDALDARRLARHRGRDRQGSRAW